MSALIKSILWLVGCSGLGYGLFIVALSSSQNDDFVKNYKLEKDDKKKTFMDVLDSAAKSNKPLYRMNKEEVVEEINKK